MNQTIVRSDILHRTLNLESSLFHRYRSQADLKLMFGAKSGWKVWLSMFFPCIEWLVTYNWKKNIVTDIIAGLSVGAMIVPQSIAYAGASRILSIHRSCYDDWGFSHIPHRTGARCNLDIPKTTAYKSALNVNFVSTNARQVSRVCPPTSACSPP